MLWMGIYSLMMIFPVLAYTISDKHLEHFEIEE